jgi:ATP-dependent helicase HrpB
VFRTRDQIRDIVRRRGATGFDAAPRSPADDSELRLRRAIASAWLDRLCRRREPASDRAVMVGGRGVRLARESAVRNAGLFVAVELDDREGVRSEALVRRASAVERAWLPAVRTVTGVDIDFDEVRERITAFQRTRFDDLVLEEKEVPIPDAEAAAAKLVEAAATQIERVLPADDPAWTALLDRIRFLRRHLPELALPEPDFALFTELLSTLVAGARSFEALRRAPWSDALRGLLTHPQRLALEREAPEKLEVPSGSRIRVDYGGERPVLAARIQELFGLADTPRLARGRVPVLLHLLAPSGRPQQVTDDLASFWSRTYPEVKKELAGRYPKHSWPADPWSAKAERKPGKRT